MRRAITVLCMVLSLIGWHQPSANAAVWSGACTVSITFQFHSALRGGLTNPSFDYTGGGVCNTTLAGTLTHFTSMGGSGSSIHWNCESTLAEGFWDQSFDPAPPEPASGNFLLTGSYGAWHLVVAAGNLVGVAELTVDTGRPGWNPVDCIILGGTELTMFGVMVFQDP